MLLSGSKPPRDVFLPFLGVGEEWLSSIIENETYTFILIKTVVGEKAIYMVVPLVVLPLLRRNVKRSIIHWNKCLHSGVLELLCLLVQLSAV